MLTTLGEMTHTDKMMNLQHFGRDLAHIRIQNWINPDIWIQIPDQFRLRLDALVEVCGLSAQSSCCLCL